MAWWDLEPDAGMMPCLDAADGHASAGAWDQLGTTAAKNRWGNVFADRCARMVADAIRDRRTFRHFVTKPDPDGGGVESLTGVGGSEGKKVDVLVSNLASGLQVAVSLKAENFPSSGGTFGKNLMNRLYELSDETRSIHSYQPRAVVVGLFFYPLHAAFDRAARSSLHRAVDKIGDRTGREPEVGSDYYRLDLGYVGLYAPSDMTTAEGRTIARRGALRFVDVRRPVPRSGRPRSEETLSLSEVIDAVEHYYRRREEDREEDAQPEPDPD
jgi:hypothetical protein